MFNEIGNIETVIRSTHAVGSATLEAFEIIVVDDCSTDGSGELAEKLTRSFPGLRVIHHEKNRKLGGALKTGFAAARMDYILYMDSDLPIAFSEVETFLKRLNEPLDFVTGYRMGGAENTYRHIQSLAYNALLSAVFGLRVRDANFAFKLFRRELIEEPPRSEGSFIDAELLLEARRRGYRIQQAGFRYQPRQAGISTLGGPRVIPKLLTEMFTYWKSTRHHARQPSREVIFNADDFGLCASINAGVIASHSRGLVRSASLICTGDAFEEAAAYARNNPSLDLGLHLSLVDGKPVSAPDEVKTLTGSNRRFLSNYSAFVLRYLAGKIAIKEVEQEFRAQLQKARDAGLLISHLDSHQHLHVLPAILEVVIRIANENHIPAIRYPDETCGDLSHLFSRQFKRLMLQLGLSLTCRLSKARFVRANVLGSDNFLGMRDAGRWNKRNLSARIAALPGGLTEICCHPRNEAVAAEPAYNWGYNSQDEFDALTSPELYELLQREKIRVTNFSEHFQAARSFSSERWEPPG